MVKSKLERAWERFVAVVWTVAILGAAFAASGVLISVLLQGHHKPTLVLLGPWAPSSLPPFSLSPSLLTLPSPPPPFPARPLSPPNPPPPRARGVDPAVPGSV